MASKKTLAVQRKTPSAVTQPATYDRLHALLHTVRSIAQYEDILCEITHETKRSGELSPKLTRELVEILDTIPSHAYLSDLNAVRSVLVAAHASVRARSKKSSKSERVGKNPSVKKARKAQ